MSISTQSTCYLIFIFLLSFIQMFSFRGHVAYKNVRRSFERSMEGPGCCYESLLPPPTPHPSPPYPSHRQPCLIPFSPSPSCRCQPDDSKTITQGEGCGGGDEGGEGLNIWLSRSLGRMLESRRPLPLSRPASHESISN